MNMAARIERTPSAYPYPLLIRHMLERAVSDHPNAQIVYGQTCRTYRQLHERVGRLANALAGLGVEAGSTVGVMDWDTNRYLECFYAVPMMGAVLHMVNVRLSPEQIVYTINHAADDILLVNVEFLPLLQRIAGQLRTVRAVVLLDDEGRAREADLQGLRCAGEYESLLEESAPDYLFPELDEDTRATTFYTTGTTGLPKGVFFSHRQLVLHTLACQLALSGAAHCRLDKRDVYMPITPMFHVHAWGMPYVATNLGLKQVYPGRYVPERLLRLRTEHGVTFSHCVPTILQMLLMSPASASADLSGWKVIIGGSALPAALAKSALERGIDVVTGYGMSETCPILTVAFLDEDMLSWDLEAQARQRAKTGRPIPLVQLRIVDGAMNELPHDGKSAGEVVVRAPWLTQGYLQDPEGSERLWRGGWLHTGDIGVIDPDGFLRITDRLKDVIKSGGEWISSLEIEGHILRVPGVAEVAVIGVPDERWGERPLAFVVPSRPGAVSSEDILEALRRAAEAGEISRYAVPDRIVFLEEIPKTSVGKINKRALRERYGAA